MLGFDAVVSASAEKGAYSPSDDYRVTSSQVSPDVQTCFNRYRHWQSRSIFFSPIKEWSHGVCDREDPSVVSGQF
jgi:hypothetical protein